MDDQRRHPRRKSFLGAKASFHHSGSSLACLVRDLSDSGAKLEFQHPKDVPAEFDLLITARRQSVRCRVVWTKGTLFGVAFVGPAVSTVGLLRRVA